MGKKNPPLTPRERQRCAVCNLTRWTHDYLATTQAYAFILDHTFVEAPRG